MRPHRAHHHRRLACLPTVFGHAINPTWSIFARPTAKGQIPVICTRGGWTEQQLAVRGRLRSAGRGPAMAAASGSKASYAPVSQAEGTEDPSAYADDESEAPTKCVHKSRPLVSRSIRGLALTGPASLNPNQITTRATHRAVPTGGRARRSSSGATASSPRFPSACSSSTLPGRWRSPR